MSRMAKFLYFHSYCHCFLNQTNLAFGFSRKKAWCTSPVPHTFNDIMLRFQLAHVPQ